ELRRDVCDRPLTQPRQLDCPPPELGWVPGSHLGLLPGRPNRHSLGVRETGSGSPLAYGRALYLGGRAVSQACIGLVGAWSSLPSCSSGGRPDRPTTRSDESTM